MGRIIFTIPGVAVPWARAGRRGGASYTPRKQANFAGAIRAVASRAMNGASPLTGPVAVRLEAVYVWPKSMSARKRLDPINSYKATRPDLDNVAKIVTDAMNGIVYGDDGQIAVATHQKRFADRAMLRVEVWPVADEIERAEAAE